MSRQCFRQIRYWTGFDYGPCSTPQVKVRRHLSGAINDERRQFTVLFSETEMRLDFAGGGTVII
jgi:hypothetical protein